MTSVIIFLLFTMLEILNVIAQEGSIPKETCKIFQYDLQHGFITNPQINLEKLTANKETIEGLKRFITSEERCSIVTDIRIFEITYNNKPVGIIPITYTEIIKLQVSANRTIEKPRDRVTKLAICFDAVSTAVAADANFRNSLRLNISGTLDGSSPAKGIVVDDKSCCHVLYEQPENINQCCKPDFIEDGEDNCACPKGQFLKNNISCEPCPKDTYQPNPTRKSCLQCPNGETTYGKTGADSRSSCLTACLPGQSYNETSQNCITCPKNTYQPLGGQLDCINCEDDTITKKSGSTRREDCVESCSQGSFYSFAKSACELCPKNFFQTQKGQFNCTPCQSGKVTVFNGTKVEEDCLTNCSQGLFFNQTKQKCEECPLHTYQPRFGTIKCLSCPDGGRTLNTSSIMLGDCSKKCSVGLFHNFTSRQCESCPLHYYQPKPGQTSCIRCRNGKITLNVATKSKKDCIRAKRIRIKQGYRGLMYYHHGKKQRRRKKTKRHHEKKIQKTT